MRRVAAILAVVALGLCYASTIGGMVHQWWTDEDMGYAFLVPFVIGWIVWRERARLGTLPIESSPWGFALLVLGGSLQVVSVLGAGLFAGALGFLLSLIGALLC